jgi:outer membrane protein OmpA-like peptidoglycan-associated protein
MKCFLFALTLISSFASAQTYNYAKKIGIGGGYGRDFPLFNTGPVNGHGGASADLYDLHARYGINSAGAIILSFEKLDLAKTSVNQYDYGIMYLHRLNALGRISPVFGGGVSFIDYSKLNSRNDWARLSARVRAGIEYSITQNLMASFDVDLRWIENAFRTSTPSHTQMSLVPQVNLTWFFGCGESCEKKKTEPMKKAEHATVAAVDGDSDNDGIANSKDKCPNSAAGSTVNAYGCVAKEKAHIEVEVMFASSSAVVPAVSHEKIQELADFLKEHSKTKAEIQGHTDSSGVPAKNKILSQKRADAVKAYLVTKLGVDPSRISSIGHGSEQPVADNKTVEGRAENRRVMAVIEE